MNAPRKLAAYAAVVAAVFGASVVVGGAVDPTGLATASPAEAHGNMAAGMTLGGLASAEEGLRLIPATDVQRLGVQTTYRFQIVNGDGPVTDFDVQHTKRMHLIVVRRDLTEFQHLHPAMRTDGTWQIPVELDDAGTYRVFADFAVDGHKHTLGADLSVPGDVDPQPLPTPTKVADAGDGYTVELHGTPVAGNESQLTFIVRRNGAVIEDLDPYLGALGHLVALRAGDLAYLHVHADEDRLAFETELPTAGSYRLFLQFQRGGVVRTAAFTVDAEESR